MSYRILVVDDTRFLRMMLSDLLKKSGYEVVGEAENGVVGVEMFEQLRPDIVMLDITMPEMDGITALGHIRSIDPEAIVLICSAMSQRDLISKALKAGANGYVLKPFEPKAVNEIIDEVLPLIEERNKAKAAEEEAIKERQAEEERRREEELREQQAEEERRREEELREQRAGESLEQLSVSEAAAAISIEEKNGDIVHEFGWSTSSSGNMEVEAEPETSFGSAFADALRQDETLFEAPFSEKPDDSRAPDESAPETKEDRRDKEPDDEKQMIVHTKNEIDCVEKKRKNIRNLMSSFMCNWAEDIEDVEFKYSVVYSEMDQTIRIEMIKNGEQRQAVQFSLEGFSYLVDWLKEKGARLEDYIGT